MSDPVAQRDNAIFLLGMAMGEAMKSGYRPTPELRDRIDSTVYGGGSLRARIKSAMAKQSHDKDCSSHGGPGAACNCWKAAITEELDA